MSTQAKIDPMHQFTIAPIGGDALTGSPFAFTNSSLWMLIVLGAITLFMLGGMQRRLVPGRWQMAVEGLTGFSENITSSSIGPEGRKYLPWVVTVFVFILFANWIGSMPFGIVPGAHPFTVTSQFTVTGFMSVISFAIVLGVGFWKHGLHFFSLFVPKGAPFLVKCFIAPIEFISFMVRPFSLGLRPFVTMKLPNTSSRMCPANIATNGRRPRLNGRTMNEMNSIGAMKHLTRNGAPFGTNSEKKCRPCFQKPTPSTIAKLITLMKPVTVNWLVTVNG